MKYGIMKKNQLNIETNEAKIGNGANRDRWDRKCNGYLRKKNTKTMTNRIDN